MASSLFPAINNTSADTNLYRNSAAVVTTTSSAVASLNSTTNASKNLRGLNKPKCIKCGNVARSRCPYQSCKNCCAKAQNPCHIHVLKGNSTIPDKAPSSGSPLAEQQPTDASPSGGKALKCGIPHAQVVHAYNFLNEKLMQVKSLFVALFFPSGILRVTSLRQLSNNFSQFSNLQSPLRSRKPLTRKEAEQINEWRYQKLKEYKDGNIEAENEAFDHYMRNVSLPEEVFNVNSAPEGPIQDGGSPTSNPNPTCVEDVKQMAIVEIKSRLGSDPTRAEDFRNRMQDIVDKGLKELQKTEVSNDVTDISAQDESVKILEKKKLKRTDAISDLNDKLNKARNEEDLKLCEEMKAQIFDQQIGSSQVEYEGVATPVDLTFENDAPVKPPRDNSPPKWFRAKPVDPEELKRMAERFASLQDIEL